MAPVLLQQVLMPFKKFRVIWQLQVAWWCELLAFLQITMRGRLLEQVLLVTSAVCVQGSDNPDGIPLILRPV